MQSLYEILGVEKTASAAAIKESFRAKAKKLHPDAGGNREKFEELQKAYETLSDPDRRAAYDETGTVSDSAAVNTDAGQAIAFLSELVIGVVNDKSVNLVADDVQELLSKMVLESVHELEEVIQEGKGRLLRAAEFRKRMIRTDGAAGDPIAVALDFFEAQAAARLESLESSIRIKKIALTILEKYGYDFVKKIQAPVSHRAEAQNPRFAPNINKGLHRGFFFSD